MVPTQLCGPERLADLDLSVELFSRVLRRADADAGSCSPLDPPILQGLLRWARATRFLREELVPAGWTFDNPRNLARTIHPTGDFSVVIATGDDSTGVAAGRAGARHRKGYATELAVNANGQLSFDFGSLVHISTTGFGARIGHARTWLLLFCPDDHQFRVELSLPEAIEDGRISRWTERILLPPVARDPSNRSQAGPESGNWAMAANVPTVRATSACDTPEPRTLIDEPRSGNPRP